MLNIFSCMSLPPYVFFGKMFVQIFAYLKNWVVYFLIIECENSLYILDCSLLSDRNFADTFLWPMAFIFIFFNSIVENKILILMTSNLSLFFFYEPCFLCLKKSLLTPGSQRFSSTNFVLLDITFGSMIHFVLNFY